MPRWTTNNTRLEETKNGPRLLSRFTGLQLGTWSGMRPPTMPRRMRHLLAIDEVNSRRHKPTLAERYPETSSTTTNLEAEPGKWFDGYKEE